MSTEIIREFDPNIYLPEELKNAIVGRATSETEEGDPEAEVDIQWETLGDDESALNEDDALDDIDPPQYITIVEQVVRTDPSGRQVVDMVIEVEDVEEDIGGVAKFDVRVTKE